MSERSEAPTIDVSIVMPCLNEARTVEACVTSAHEAITSLQLNGEVIVADNGSLDGSQEIAVRAGARVVHAPIRGYGSAIRAGCSAARGRFLVVGDADQSYDFGEIGPMIEGLRNGSDIVIGSRFKGRILPGAMPWKNRVIGNPLLTWTLRLLFRAPEISDAHSGLRAMTRDAYDALNLRTPGMEFASEMIVRASKLRLKISEVPITLRPAGRERPPHLRPWRDGWRHLKFMFMFAPGALFLLPGVVLMVVGGLLVASQLFAPPEAPLYVGRLRLDFHWAIFGGLLCVVGYQIINAYFFARIYSVTHDLRTEDVALTRAFRYVTLERALMLGLLMTALGIGVLTYVFVFWIDVELGLLPPRMTRLVIFGSTLTAIGVQTMSNAFVFSIIGDRFQRRLLGAEFEP